ncbi:hypothetical protein SLS62_007554 [Diatrype stigma]|uniref:Uncharacterized protein n=1 Tax=Diatrype stigma TaxID=117547 RepID=A0AAN9UQL1_9PEZI
MSGNYEKLRTLTDEGRDVTDEANAKGKALSRPIAFIQRAEKHIFYRAVWRQVQQRGDYRNKPKNMDQKDHAFEDGQEPSNHSVDKNAHGNHSPGEKCPMKVLRFIFWVVQDDEPLDHRSCKDAAHSECGDPRK